MTSLGVWHVALVLGGVFNFASTAPEITSFDKVSELRVGTLTNEVLATITCEDPDGDLTRTQVLSVQPTSPCANCFEVLDCGAAECLQYRAGVGTLSYAAAPRYLITIQCEDTNEPAATEVIQINVVPNTAPYFNNDFRQNVISGSAVAGSLLFTAAARDDDPTDTLRYSMTVVPASSTGSYEIDDSSGAIRNTVDMRSECRGMVTFLVTASDGINTAGPMVVQNRITNANTAPVAMNMNREVKIPEDATGTVYTMDFIDPDGDPLTYTYTTTNAAGWAQFSTIDDPPKIDTNTALNYEDSTLRQTNIVVQATDGFCTSPEYSLRLTITDVNEQPILSPTNSHLEVCEGKSEFPSGLVIQDEDTLDTHTWKYNSPNFFGRHGVDPDNGLLLTNLDYDIDVPTHPVSNEYIISVEDKGKLSDTATVTVTFLDCNDNHPFFDGTKKEHRHTFAATECQAGGSVLGTISADDDDSAREQNNVLVYSGSGGSVSVDSGGSVILNTPLPAGNVITFNAQASDQGQTPGPLTSEQPSVITVYFTVCPTPPPTVSAAPVTAAPTTTTAAPTAAPVRDDADNLAWIIIAALLGTLMLGLLTFMLYRYWPMCVSTCSKINCQKRCCKTRTKLRPMNPVKRRPIEKITPARRPPPPAKPEPEVPEAPPPPPGPGFLFGFWKERYPDDDFKFQPQRKDLPTPGDMDDHYPHTFDPLEPPPQATQATPVPPQKKKCIVM
ncbi:cadherin-related family member 2 [Aplysia californica]|uniref:Cadherin-related family member 2 n=1 Tax=Aplysia californica TaxID=6500 RepID=A0ABM1VS29_APLCA|nr:cadherin-related family member 2 [Aplysia californica]